jgi:hypothetical protein
MERITSAYFWEFNLNRSWTWRFYIIACIALDFFGLLLPIWLCDRVRVASRREARVQWEY